MSRSNNQRIDEIWNGLRNNNNSNNKILLLDGGTGEEIFQRGVPDDRKIWSATALVNPQYHSILADVHRSFLEAGADAITTNSYGVVPGVGFSLEEIAKHVPTAGRIAREVVDEFCSNDPNKKQALVLGSLGPLLESYRWDKIMNSEEGMEVYMAITKALLPFVDCFIAETMSCVEESSQAIRAVGRLVSEGNGRPLIVSYTLETTGNLRNGESATSAVTRTLNLCHENNVILLGVLFNCAEPEAITKALTIIHGDASLQQNLRERGAVTGAYANRLTPVDPNWSLADSDAPQPARTDLSIERYSKEFVSSWVEELGAKVVGGCCGITPEYIAQINKCAFRKN